MNTIIGNAFVGDGLEAAHVILAIGTKGTPFETSFLNALTHRAKGHTSSLALLEPNLPCKPFTLIANEMAMRTAEQVSFFLGPVNAAVSHAVIDSVADGTIPKEMAEELLILATVFVHWDAKIKQKVYDNNYAATLLAIDRAFSGEPTVDEILGKRDGARHYFYQSSASQDDQSQD